MRQDAGNSSLYLVEGTRRASGRSHHSERLFRCSGLFGGFAAAAALGGAADGGFADQLGGPDRGDELLQSVAIEINRGAFEVRLGDSANAVLLVTNCLAF